jgi:hypothetical protein
MADLKRARKYLKLKVRKKLSGLQVVKTQRTMVNG